MSQQRVDISVTADYASHWKTWEGVRELVQNWHDGILDTLASLHSVSLNSAVQFRKLDGQEKYEVFVRNSDRLEEVVGTVHYDCLSSTLTLVNHRTLLAGQCLLFGYSRKANTRRSIGQFGEGMKIGILALLRDGHHVSCDNGPQKWVFDIANSQQFKDTKVLCVHMSGGTPENPFEEGFGNDSNDLTFILKGLAPDNWKTFVKRFLFLTPPQKAYSTHLGRLLLDGHLRGQIYVKGIWVNDQREDDLYAGADFQDLVIDRDRRTVVHPSDIDHKISAMWGKVIEENPDLAVDYYILLKQNKHRDVKHSATFCSEEVAVKVKDLFIREHGCEAFPLLNTLPTEDYSRAQEELRTTIVMCNAALHSILLKSQCYVDLDTALMTRVEKADIVPFTSLAKTQHRVLTEALQLSLLGGEEKSFPYHVMDISSTQEQCRWMEGWMRVPVWMLDTDKVHQVFQACTPHTHSAAAPEDLLSDGCKCAPTYLCLSLLQHLPGPNTTLKVGKGGNQLLPVVSRLASQVCGRVEKAFCYENHIPETRERGGGSMLTEEKERGYLEIIEQQSKALEQERQASASVVLELKGKVASLDKVLQKQELDIINNQHAMEDRCQQKIKSQVDKMEAQVSYLQKMVSAKEEQLSDLRRELEWKDKQLMEQLERARFIAEPLERRSGAITDELVEFVHRHQQTLKSMHELVKSGSACTDQDMQTKLDELNGLFDTIIPELQGEKVLCALCKNQRKSEILQPCGHYALCLKCAENILQSGTCPLCREEVEGHMTVYE